MKTYFFGLIVAMLFVGCKLGGSNSAAESPKGAINEMMASTKSGDFKALQKHMCKKDAEAFDKIMKMAESFAALSGKTMEELVKEQMKKTNKFDKDEMKFDNEKIDGNTATLDAENTKTKEKSTIHFVKEDGKWKFCEGIADKMNNQLGKNGLLSDSLGEKIDLDKTLEKAKDILNDPKTKELLNSPEMKKAMEQMNDPKKLEEMKKAMESLKNLKQ